MLLGFLMSCEFCLVAKKEMEKEINQKVCEYELLGFHCQESAQVLNHEQ